MGCHAIEFFRRMLDKQPMETGEDGRATLEALLAAYESAGTGRKVPLPFKTDAARPHDLWRRT